MQVTTKAQRTHSIALYSYAIWPLTSIIVLTPHHALFLPVFFTNVLLLPAIDHGCYLHNLLNTTACLVGVLSSGFPNVSIFPITLPPLIDSRIKYKLACICYNSLSTNSPPYLSDLLTVYTASRQLRSCSDNSVLRRPSVRTVSYGQRSFAYSAPSAWNALPQQVRSSDSVSTFRSRTKTHLFRLAY